MTTADEERCKVTGFMLRLKRQLEENILRKTAYQSKT